MSKSTLERFDHLWHITFYTDEAPGTSSEPHLRLTKEHAAQMVADGNAGQKPKGEKKQVQWVEAFTTVEEKEEALRQRIIMWTKVHNSRVKEKYGYVPDVPLGHVSEYLEAALEEMGGTRDLLIGFFQIEIPMNARHRFQFLDDEGNVYQLWRLPMGHRCSPEICQILLSVLAGLPEYCSPQHVRPGKAKIKIWVDNVHAAGTVADVKMFFEWFDRQAAASGATLNAKDSKMGDAYTFIGVAYDHKAHTVASKPKTVKKILAAPPIPQMTIADAQSIFGRLTHVSAILDVDVGAHWWFTKILRRRLSQLNRGLARPDDPCLLPPSAQSDLAAWIKLVVENKPRQMTRALRPAPPSFTLYTDSSLSGCGAVLVCRRTQQIWVAGAKWRVTPDNINPGEVRAITYGLHVFRHHFPRGTHIDIRCDNTSAIAGAHKGSSKVLAMHVEIRRLVAELKLLGVTVDIAYVSSLLNWADGPSRGDMSVTTIAETMRRGDGTSGGAEVSRTAEARSRIPLRKSCRALS